MHTLDKWRTQELSWERDERSKEKTIFRGNTPWISFYGGGVYIYINKSEYFLLQRINGV